MLHRLRVLLGVLVMAALVPEPAASQAGWMRFAAPDGSFTVLVPAAPRTQPSNNEGGVATHAWTVPTAYGGYVFAYSDYPSIPSADAELQASTRNFVRQMQGRVVAQRRSQFRSVRGAMLPAVDFTYRTENGRHGSGRIVVDGNRAYMWVTVVVAGQDRSAETTRYFASIAITAPAR